ncbi:MAG: septal ring lytic transglycosylase RlpA family protein [Gammaproteobacteria bacterium]|nr:septal ring lytic transglycosylase RlpA family protein [Gammaproteobacteria bacterium]
MRAACACTLAVLVVAACAQFPTGDYGPAHPVDVSQIPDAVPRVEPRSPYGNPSSYTVDGQDYRVLPNCHGYHERGIASWYGSKFHGGRTADGETYDMYAMTAANKVLPLPCYVRVTNLQNDRSVVVKVNDRGPFVENRIIDLSYAAAAKIGMLGTGTALVEVQAVTPGEPVQPAGPGSSQPLPSGIPATGAATGSISRPQLFLQLGAFAERNNAQRLLRRLQAANIAPAFILTESDGARTLYKLRVGPIPDVAQVDSLTARLATLGFSDTQVVIP